ncbi:hypothetical protein Egran_03575 [Elaphomyces granulatus]|uniref:Core domain-containing protein n=1 Tax=Elaphomyces granulatus TaxID=519963 RepID=A0A232LX27_9EURO|nr:hypothetical protein Egran_03575 [Elaphomyces granulatus]
MSSKASTYLGMQLFGSLRSTGKLATLGCRRSLYTLSGVSPCLYSICQPKPRKEKNSKIYQTDPSPQRLVNYTYHPRCNITSSVSPPACATTVVLNPQYGEEGRLLQIDISPRAAKMLKENPYHHLRITVMSGGCHGFQYLMSLESTSKINPEEDTVFEAEPQAGDSSSATVAGAAKVVMDAASLELLSGSTVDYTTELIGSQFKIVDNPRATSNCGCGTSFDVKD